MIYLLGNAPVQAWLKSPDLRRETCGSLVLYLPPSPKRDVLILAMKDIDERLAAAKNFKHGQKTRAAFITLPDGSECFGKSVQIAKMRLENRFRYVVAPTRGLWAAAVAQRLREIGVPTPEVWGAGERRPRLFPTVSYLFTEILRVTQLDVWLRNSDALMDEAERILPRLGRMIGRLHGGRITHNDLKPENVYLSADEEPGLWDLDPAKIHRDAIPIEARAFEFSRIVAGTRISLICGFTSVFGGAVIGTALGLIAGFYEGWADRIIMRISDVLFAFPGILLAIGIVAILGGGMLNVVAAVAIFSIPAFARLVRANVLSLKTQTYVEAAKSLGISDGMLLIRHILPGTISVIMVYLTMRIGTSIITAASLSFLGLGAQPPMPEWGAMLNEARADLMTAPHAALFPVIAIFLTVLAFNLLGDGLRDALDPKVDTNN